jgi:hydrogenase maturation protease
MESLSQHLLGLHGRVCLMCIGNAEGGDDAFGVRLGEELARAKVPHVVIAGTEPEQMLLRGVSDRFEHLIFVDAVDVGAAPGSVVFLNTDEMASRFPQVSTHRLSLGLLAGWVEARGTTKAWLLGVQPESLQRRHELSPCVRRTMAVLCELLKHSINAELSAVC